jgi:hypothetical protein
MVHAALGNHMIGKFFHCIAASAQAGAARIAHTLLMASAKDAKRWKLEGSHLNYVRLDMAIRDRFYLTQMALTYCTGSKKPSASSASPYGGECADVDRQPHSRNVVVCSS